MKIKLFPPQAIHELGQRDNQEDAIYPLKGKATADDKLFLVCDGMGGHAKGEVASRTVAATIATYLKKNLDATQQALTNEMLMKAIDEAYKALDERDDGSFKKMGTTLTLVSFHKGGATVAHIGDSRIYHLRPSTGEILYKSRDHSLVYELYQAGEMSYHEMKSSPQKNVITRAMMPGEDSRTRADIVHISDIRPGDYFYHCSDGMLEEMDDEDIMEIFKNDDSDQLKASKLVKATTGSKDNHSAYLLHVAAVEKEPGDEAFPNDEATAMCNAVNIERRLGKADLDIMDVESDDDDEITQPTPPPVNVKNNDDATPPAVPPEVAAAAATAAAEAKAAGLTPPPAPMTPPPAPTAVDDASEITKPIPPAPVDSKKKAGMGAPAGFDPKMMPPAPERPKRSTGNKIAIALLILLILGLLGGGGWWYYKYYYEPGKKGSQQPKVESSASESSASESSVSDDDDPIDQDDIKPDDQDVEIDGRDDKQDPVENAINHYNNSKSTGRRERPASTASSNANANRNTNGYNTRRTQQLNQGDVQNQDRGAADNPDAARRQIQNMQPRQVITIPSNGSENSSDGDRDNSNRNIRRKKEIEITTNETSK